MKRINPFRPLAWTLAALCAALIPSCGSDDSPANDGKTLCDPGTTQSCTGPGACLGGQTCSSDGKSWQPCDCTGSGGTGSGGTAGVDASAGSGGTSGAGAGGTSGSGGAGGADGGAGAPQDSGTGGAAPKCPTGKGPTMVDLGAFCIDSTEVTIAQYDVFLAEAKTKPPTQTTWCATNNADFEKRVPSQIAPANHPVLVDWCDARAFCAWSGKRLCGKIGGAAMSYNTPETKDPKASEHAFACTQGGTTVHPYGDVYDKFACNYAQPFPVGLKLKPVASFPGCTGQSAPYDQVYDLVGNGTEWLDACDLALTSPGPYCTLAREECAASTGSAPINGAAIRCCK